MAHERIAVLGGGVAGVVLASELADMGRFDIDILERDDRLGGLQRSYEFDGAVYDIGTFVFDRAHELLKTFPILRESFVLIDHRTMSLTRCGSIDRYPMTLRGYVRDHGIAHCAWAAVDLLASKVIHRRRDTLVAFVKYYLGRTIYEGSGLKCYIERFYCTEDTNVDLEFARMRLRGLPGDCGLRKNFRKIIRDARNPGIVREAWQCFVRPPEGFGTVYATVHDDLVRRGVRVLTGTRIERITRVDGGHAVHTAHGVEHYDHVISTIPVPVASEYMGIPLEGGFETMSLVSLYYRLDGDLGVDSSCLYNFTGDGRWKRLTIFSNQYGRCDGDEYFVVECTVRGRGEEQIEEQRRAFEEHIRGKTVLRGTLRYQGGTLTRDAYPFYKRGDTARMAEAKQRLVAAGLHLAGRQGSFAYLNSHETALASKQAAHVLAGGEAKV